MLPRLEGDRVAEDSNGCLERTAPGRVLRSPSAFIDTGGLCRRRYGTNAETNNYWNCSTRSVPTAMSSSDGKALESCTFSDRLVAVGTEGVNLAAKRFVVSSPIASTRNGPSIFR
jgi:hypothetical protein